MCKLTASGLIFASGWSNFQFLVLSISITPSMMAWATWMPLGPNSLANDCAKALNANFPVANDEQRAEPLIAAVADVNIKVGGNSGEASTWSRRSGRTA